MSDQRTDAFIDEIAAIRLRGSGRDRLLVRLGAVAMAAGVVVGIVGLLLARNTDNALDQRDAIIIALIGVSVSLCGVGVFLRYSLGEFLRFWMARLLVQRQQPSSTPTPAERTLQ